MDETPSTSTAIRTKCALCHAPAVSSCARCKEVYYCVKEHQIAHWRAHKKVCRLVPVTVPFIITTDPVLGKQWVAARDLDPGTILLDEVAALTVWDDPPDFRKPMCIVCGLVYSFRKRCTKCKWPVCSKTCENAEIHSKNECKVFHQKRINFPPPPSFNGGCSFFATLLFLIRAIGFKQRDPPMYNDLIGLYYDPDISSTTLEDVGVNMLIQLLSTLIDLEETKMTDEELRKLYSIFKKNSFMPRPQKDCGVMDCLYIKASRLNHSCVPNCSWEVGHAPEYKMRVRTAVALKKGEPLTICYKEHLELYGTKLRQTYLQQSCGFICNCERCLDPTELGTYTSAVVCEICRPKGELLEGDLTIPNSGYLLPKEPLRLDDEAEWECNRCSDKKSALEMDTILDCAKNYNEKLVILLSNNPRLEILMYYVKEAIEPLGRSLVHPNHFILQEASDTITRSFNQPGMTINLEGAKFFEEHMRFLLSIQDKVTPGLSRTRAFLLSDIACMIDIHTEEMAAEECIERKKEALTLREEALKFFKDKIPEPGEKVSRNYTKMKAGVDKCKMFLAMADFSLQ